MYKEIHVTLIGIGMGREKSMTIEAKAAMENADALIGAKRFLEEADMNGKTCFCAYLPDKILSIIERHPEYQKWGVLLSGDVGFYSGAKKLYPLLEAQGVRVQQIPGISSVVYLASKVGISWEDAKLCSVHGRGQNFVYAIDHHEKTFLLMDKMAVERVCNAIKEYGFDNIRCYVGNHLGSEKEQIIFKKGYELRETDFSDLTTLLVINPEWKKTVDPHLRDEEFCRSTEGKTVPMTKEEVRTVSLSKLNLTEQAVVYDIGAGTGSVSVEVACHGENVKVYAIEQREDACELIRKNKRKFRADNLEIIQGVAPFAMEGLEPPTHAFIGGSSGNLLEILRVLKEKNPSVRIVLNAISLETIGEVVEAAKRGLLREPEILQMQVSKARMLGNYHMMMGQNPVYIITESE